MTSTERALHLAQTAVARLCHDLAGSLGAIMNALEFATLEDESQAAEALQLAAEAAREVSARLRLARTLWGCDQPMPLADIHRLADGLPGRGRLQLDIDMHDPHAATLSPDTVRLLLAALSMAAESLHGPGIITLAGDISREAVIIIESNRASWPANLPTLLTTQAETWPEPDPRTLMAHLTTLLATTTQTHLSLLLTTGHPNAPPPLRIALGMG